MQLFSALTDTPSVDRYKISSWSDEFQKEVLLATLELNERGELRIEPSAFGLAHYDPLGLEKGRDAAYLVNLRNAPASLIAKALGLPGGDNAFQHAVINELGREPTGYDLLEVALHGHPAQSGRLSNADERGTHFLNIDEQQFLAADTTVLPEFDSLYTKNQGAFQGMLKTDVLIKDGSKIVPAYVVTVEGGSHENASDRLAIYAATLTEANSIEGVVADKSIRFVLTADKQPALLCEDASKPAFNLVAEKRSARNQGVNLVSVEKSLVETRRAIQPASAFQDNPEPQAVKAWVQTNVLREFAQDAQGLSVSLPGKLMDGAQSKVRMGRLEIPRHMTVESLQAMALAYNGAVSPSVQALSKRVLGAEFSADDQSVQRLKAVARRAGGLVSDIDKMMLASLAAIDVGTDRSYTDRRAFDVR
jgi:hypothetical protein